MTGVVIPMRRKPPVEKPRLCSACSNGYLGTDGVFCRVLNEVVWKETDAADCGSYQVS